jgi:hypothetical protein
MYTSLIGATPASTPTGTVASVTKSGSASVSATGSPTTLTYITKTTMPNGGPTATFLTTTVEPVGGPICVFNSQYICNSDVATYYTDGFLGFTVLTSTSVSVYSTTIESNGKLTAIRTSSTQTWTRAFSGVSRISLSTYVTQQTFTKTGTAYISGTLSTYTSTSVSIGTTTSASPLFNGAAATAAPNRYIGPAALAMAGAALAVL